MEWKVTAFKVLWIVRDAMHRDRTNNIAYRSRYIFREVLRWNQATGVLLGDLDFGFAGESFRRGI